MMPAQRTMMRGGRELLNRERCLAEHDGLGEAGAALVAGRGFTVC